jgi:Tol biopolymer transport system component
VGNTGPSWSPDGRWIAFSSTRLKDGNPEIFKMRPDGSRITRLTFTDTVGEVSPDDGFPDWSPDGRSIVFSSTRGTDQHDLWVMNADGKSVRRITDTPRFDDWGARWSRDGTRIVFFAVPFTSTVNDVYVVRADGSGFRRVTRGTTPVWRP